MLKKRDMQDVGWGGFGYVEILEKLGLQRRFRGELIEVITFGEVYSWISLIPPHSLLRSPHALRRPLSS